MGVKALADQAALAAPDGRVVHQGRPDQGHRFRQTAQSSAEVGQQAVLTSQQRRHIGQQFQRARQRRHLARPGPAGRHPRREAFEVMCPVQQRPQTVPDVGGCQE